MNERSQLLKGTLEGSILKVIKESETYGYEISEKLRNVGFSSISEGTIYPLLLRLEKNGLLVASYKDSPLGPKRKYYSLTEQGEQALKEFFVNWREIEKSVNKLFEESGEM
ncbi:PadR family transcriptional regulator [Alicyclobacillus fastidiosus]|uniref:PadR family transcriptional regulator n=1 Tax=Alicyclobacillus fastidiosus TaxID=392011 RepID=A0ABY6ZHQ8_9BACL|nr:PadR family transcriptional regulator [Alicyclobacillus fastidiosus]WAH42346.1 PadR family transcriptional regulator [Alicyclobacillus fastidiosus]GMA64154.1 PadR family transcriptional regulator [Alicyclobacillus fastidiosus]